MQFWHHAPKPLISGTPLLINNLLVIQRPTRLADRIGLNLASAVDSLFSLAAARYRRSRVRPNLQRFQVVTEKIFGRNCPSWASR